jgi:ankyrin repeat protein
LFLLGVPSGDTQDMADALVAAILNSHENMAMFLLGSGVDVERFGTRTNSHEAWSPLQAACSTGDVSIIKLLLQKGAKVNATGGDIGNALLANIDGEKRDFAVVELLLESGADLNAQVTPPTGVPTFGFALAAAVASNDLDMTRLLLWHGVDVNMIFDTYLSALQRAANMSDEMFDLLIEQGANVNLVRNYIHSADDPDPDGDVTPLQAVACRGTVRKARKLVELGAKFSLDSRAFNSVNSILRCKLQP